MSQRAFEGEREREREVKREREGERGKEREGGKRKKRREREECYVVKEWFVILAGAQKPSTAKKGVEESRPVDISRLNMRVGLIVSVEKVKFPKPVVLLLLICLANAI